MAKRPTCRTVDCHRRTPKAGREYCTACRPDPADGPAPDLQMLVAAAAAAPTGTATVLARRDDDATPMKTLGRCATCKAVVQDDTFDIPDDPASWADAYADVLTALHGHPVTLAWALTSPFTGEAPARPRLAYHPRLGVADA